MLYGDSCGHAGADNALSNIALLSGAIAVVAGVTLLAIEPSESTARIRSIPHAETVTGSCISEADLSSLVLLLKLGGKRFLRVVLDGNGNASVALPTGARLTPDADLPVLVYRVPQAAANLLRPWQVVGTVHVPE